MRTPVAVSLVLLVLASGCAGSHGPAPAAAGGGPGARLAPVPAECRAAVERARVLGRALFEDDLVSAWGTDVAVAGGLKPEQGSRGWITTRDSTGWVVHFLAERDGELLEPLSVAFPPEPSASSGRLTRHEPPRVPEPDVRVMYDALRTATRRPFQACTERYNHVVVPAARVGQQGWLVYLLASTTVTGEVVVGGHVRRHVGEDGTIVEDVKMSKDCMALPPPGPSSEHEVVGRGLSNLLWPCPTEIHVWLSLQSGQPFYVSNRTGLWEIDGTKIVFVDCAGCNPKR